MATGAALRVGLFVLLAAACKGSPATPDPIATPAPPPPARATPTPPPPTPSGLRERSPTHSDARVRAAFPNGPASENARAQIGSAPAAPWTGTPPGDSFRSYWVAEVALPHAMPAEIIRAALPPLGAGLRGHEVYTRLGDGAWNLIDFPSASGRSFDRLRTTILLVTDDDELIDAPRIAAERTWIQAVAKALGGEPVAVTGEADVARARKLVALHRQLPDELIYIKIEIVAAEGKPLAERAVWDAAYSAGFRWGDLDYFYWLPSAMSDPSVGIRLATVDDEYFFPELSSEPTATVPGLAMTFNVTHAWHPIEVFDVMVKSAHYFARRLGAKVVGDEAALRRRVERIDRLMTAAGVVPGSEAAFQL